MDHRPDIVTLNEVCENQFTAGLEQVEAAGYAMAGRFGVARPDAPTCEGNADYGNAVLSRQRILNGPDEIVSHPLPVPDGAEVRQILCVDTPLRGRTGGVGAGNAGGVRDGCPRTGGGFAGGSRAVG